MTKRAKLFVVSYPNDWGNWIEIFRGTLSECQEWADAHIAIFEALDCAIFEA